MVIVQLPQVLLFEWDKGNEKKNWMSHGILQEEAEKAFEDTERLILEDIKHSEQEQRFILFGRTKKEGMLFIVFTIRKDKVRVISARKAKRKEVLFYEKATGVTTVQQ